MKGLFACLIIAVIVLSCGKREKGITEGKKEDASVVSAGIKEYTTQSGKVFRVFEDKSMGASISKVRIYTRQFEVSNETFDLGEIDPVENVFLADLDNNGFEEFYLTTRSAGSGSYSKIYGFVSNNDKSATPVYVPEISEEEIKTGGMFNGYIGHNSFSLENGILIHKFPVYLPEDSNVNPTGGIRKIKYILVAGEAGWILKPSEIIP